MGLAFVMKVFSASQMTVFGITSITMGLVSTDSSSTFTGNKLMYLFPHQHACAPEDWSCPFYYSHLQWKHTLCPGLSLCGRPSLSCLGGLLALPRHPSYFT